MLKNFNDIKIGDKFIHTAFNKVDSYDKPIHTHATKVKNVVEVVHINDNEDNSQIVFKYVNGTGSIFIYEWTNAGNFNLTYNEWPDIEIKNYCVYRNIIKGSIHIIEEEFANVMADNSNSYKLIGKLHHDYDKNNDRDELSLSDI